MQVVVIVQQMRRGVGRVGVGVGGDDASGWGGVGVGRGGGCEIGGKMQSGQKRTIAHLVRYIPLRSVCLCP